MEDKKCLLGCNIGKLDLLSSYKDSIEEALVKIINLWDEIIHNIEDEEKFQSELSQSLRFLEQVTFSLKRLDKFIFEKKGTPIVN